jgi:hypothetical protein
LKIEDLNKNMAKAIVVLEQIENKKDVISSVKNLFKSKKSKV